jgi:hypothetical protein
MNIKFINANLTDKYEFNCTLSGTDLTCITPKISTIDFPPFYSENLKLASNNGTISNRYILYEQTNIDSFFPQVIPESQGDFLLNLTLKNETTIKEGKMFLTLAKFTEQDVRYDLGALNKQLTINQTISSLSKGVYEMELFYFNPGSFEIRSMFSVSALVNITFVGTSTISLLSNKDLFYVDTNENITVQIDNMQDLYLSEVRKEFVKCKLGNTILPTYYIGNQKFLCSVVSSIPKEDSVSMIYRNADAHNQEILLSSNQLKIVFTGKSIHFN